MGNAFQKKVAPKTADKAEVIAETTDEIKAQVDQFVNNKAAMKKLEAQQTALEEVIIGHVRPQQDEMAYCGSFTKSMNVPGKDFSVKFVTMDRFSISQEPEALDALKKLVGKAKYEEMFETKELYTIKSEISKDDKKMNALAKACEAANIDIALYFDRVEKVVGKDDLDKKQYELPKKSLDEFRVYAKQAKPSLR